MKIYFIRHGECFANISKITPQPEDDKLTPNGENQAVKTGEYLKNYRFTKSNCDAIFCSPLERAKQTAHLISKTIGFDSNKIIYDDRLKEAYNKSKIASNATEDNKKIMEYFDVFKSKYKDPIQREYHLSEFDEKVAKIYNKETNESMMARMNEFIDNLKKTNYEKILIIAHGGIMTFGLTRLFNLPVMTIIPMGKMVERDNCWISYVISNKKNTKFKMITAPTNEHLII